MKHLFKIYFISGSMKGGKSRALIDLINSAREYKFNYLVYKPIDDTRDGLYIKSRDYKESIPAKPWYAKSDNRLNEFTVNIMQLKNMSIFFPCAVFFDEIHFLPLEDMKFIVETCKKYGIPLYMSGLETSFDLTYFESGKWLKENCTDYIFYNGNCDFCGKPKAIYNPRVVNGKMLKDGPSLLPGDDIYKVCCENCIDSIK